MACITRNCFARLIGLGLLLVTPLSAWSETLTDAWAIALQSHQRIAAARMQREAAGHDLDNAKSERYPSLDVVGAFTQFDDAPRFAFGDTIVSPKLFSNDNQVTTTAQVSMPLFTSKMLHYGVAAAQSAADASQWQLEVVMQDVKLRVAGHYLQVLRAESAMVVAESNVKSLAAHTKDAKSRFDVGAVPQNDYLAASVSLANAKQRQLHAENALDLARAAYNQVLGRPLATPVSLDPGLSLDTLIRPGQNLEDLTQLAHENRRELSTFESRAAALREQSAAERARRRPQLMLTGGYTYLENEFLDMDQFWSVGVALQWNLFDSGRTDNRVAALDRKAMAVTHEREDLATLISLEVRQAWLDRQEAISRQAVAEAVVEQAIENLRVTQDRYRAGAGLSSEALDAEALRAQSLNNRDNARFDAAFAQLRLARSAGVL
jgi:outer membrane protein TolC